MKNSGWPNSIQITNYNFIYITSAIRVFSFLSHLTSPLPTAAPLLLPSTVIVAPTVPWLLVLPVPFYLSSSVLTAQINPFIRHHAQIQSWLLVCTQIQSWLSICLSSLRRFVFVDNLFFLISFQFHLLVFVLLLFFILIFFFIFKLQISIYSSRFF